MIKNRSGYVLWTAMAFACAFMAPKGAAAAYPPSYYNYYSGDNPLFNFGDVDVKPVPMVQMPPRLATELTNITTRATVTVEFVISKNGATENIIVVKSTDSRFNYATVAAVKRWSFKAALKAGKRVNCRVQQELTFN